MTTSFRRSPAGQRLSLGLKRLLYGRRGEPYRINGVTLRYLPGTRPVRPRYATADDRNARFDALQVAFVATELGEGDVAIDVGAHAGQYSLLMASMCGASGTVVAIEPDPYARETLARNIALNPGVNSPLVEAFALSDSPGHTSLFSRRGNSQSSLVRAAVDFGDGGVEEIAVPVTTLDQYLEELGLVPQFVKIDAEGAEIRILKGAARLLAGDAGVVCELHPYAWQALGNTFHELREIVYASGRRMRYLDEQQEASDIATYGTVVLERIR